MECIYEFVEVNRHYIDMLCAIDGSARSIDRAALSMDPLITQASIDRAALETNATTSTDDIVLKTVFQLYRVSQCNYT